MATRLPYEVKRSIFGYVDLASLKALRLVSSSWAVVGVELLLLPTFTVKSSSIDIPRLLNIGASPDVSRQAAKIVRTVKFHSTDWDSKYMRSIFCSRHTHLSDYEVVDFVATSEEQQALEELDATIERRRLDDKQEQDQESLIHAFRQVPQVKVVEIVCPNVFRHSMLRKVWDEYNLETYRSLQTHEGSRQLIDILLAAKEAGLEIRGMGHDQLTSYFFTGAEDLISPDIYRFLDGLKSLTLTICDQPQQLESNEIARTRIRKLISASPDLESIYIKFELLTSVPLDILPESQPMPTKLQTLTLSGVSMDPARFLSFLEQQNGSLRQLSVSSTELVEGTWRHFLEELKDKLGSTLEKFQLTGVLKSADAAGETWMLLPIYNPDFTDYVYSNYEYHSKTKAIETYVLGGGGWPMTSEDDISSFLT